MGTYKVGDTVRAIDVHETGLSYGTVYTVEDVETRQYGRDLLKIGLDWYSERRFEPSQRWLTQVKQGGPKVAEVLFAEDTGYPNPVKQVGGDHYKNKAIQPIEYIMANGLPFCEGAVVKYITRHAEKGGADDIRKAIHFCEFILQHKYKQTV